MTYELGFYEDELKEWNKLDPYTRQLFRSKLIERLHQPRIPASKLVGHPDRYKIKLRSLGFRLVYEVRDTEVLVLVVAIGKRDKNQVYTVASKR
jgi:mRNA interferase RelE/StbE